MFRSILAGLVLSAGVSALPALANTELVVTRGNEAGPVIHGGDAVAVPCLVSANRVARLYFTITDPEGVDYAAVDLGAVAVRPAVSDHAEAYLWIAPGTRENRAYRWRLEDDPPFRARRIIPVEIEVVGDPIDGSVKVKDGAGNIVDIPFRLAAETVLCR